MVFNFKVDMFVEVFRDYMHSSLTRNMMDSFKTKTSNMVVVPPLWPLVPTGPMGADNATSYMLPVSTR